MESVKKKLKNLKTVLELQQKVNTLAEENKLRVAALSAKFDTVQKEAFDECPVCYNEISVKNACCMPNCDHRFCKGCYYNWLDKQEKNTCPMCRDEIFKTNDDIKTKRSTLQHHLDSLETEVAEMYHERRTIRKSLGLEKDHFEVVKENVYNMERKYEQLDDEVWYKQDILKEIRNYTYNPEEWRKIMEKRVRTEIIYANKHWRVYMKSVFKQLKEKYHLKCFLEESKGGYNSSYFRKELKRLMKEGFMKKIKRQAEVCIEVEVEIPTSWFEEDDEEEGDLPVEDYLGMPDDTGSDMSTSDNDSMPELEEGTPPGLEEGEIYEGFTLSELRDVEGLSPNENRRRYTAFLDEMWAYMNDDGTMSSEGINISRNSYGVTIFPGSQVNFNWNYPEPNVRPTTARRLQEQMIGDISPANAWTVNNIHNSRSPNYQHLFNEILTNQINDPIEGAVTHYLLQE